MQMVFQDPFSSLDPRMNVLETISEGIVSYGLTKSRAETEEKVYSLMERCGLFPEQAFRYAHQFSGGQRQRICIARALATDPDFIVLDEAVSALDVSIQAQIINLLKDLQESIGLTYLFISHDLNIVRFISDTVAVMYLGEIVEYGTEKQIFSHPMHPYTIALLSAEPAFTKEEKAGKDRIILEGDLPSPYEMPKACRFAGRCPFASPECSQVKPEWTDRGDGHFCMCHKSF
jgi:peptide/nickel transport system ATP-binding protein/oligopeptide transport system ATP-binding protein